jgi:5'-3' exonuclease
MLLDAASLYFRAFYGIPADQMRAPDGTPVNAVRGFLDFIARFITARSPDRLVACMDNDWRPAFRVALIPSYKTHRLANPGTGAEKVPYALQAQVPIITDVLDALGIAYIGADGFEADDVIGTLSVRAAGPVDVVTSDRDLFQLVDDARGVRVVYVARGVARSEVIDEATVAAKYGIPGRAYAEFAALRGDPSDGLPGVEGIGASAAATMISRFGDVERLLDAVADSASDMSPDIRRRLDEAREYLGVAPDVVRVRLDVPLPALDDALPHAPHDPERLLELSDRWNLRPSLNRLLNALASV